MSLDSLCSVPSLFFQISVTHYYHHVRGRGRVSPMPHPICVTVTVLAAPQMLGVNLCRRDPFYQRGFPAQFRTLISRALNCEMTLHTVHKARSPLQKCTLVVPLMQW